MLRYTVEGLRLILCSPSARKAFFSQTARNSLLTCSVAALLVWAASLLAEFFYSTVVYSYSNGYHYVLGCIWWGILLLIDTTTLVTLLITSVALLREIFDNVLRGLALSEPIEADHGDTLAEVIVRLHHQPVEYSAHFGPNRQKITEQTILNTGRCVTKWTLPTETISVHNHPDGDFCHSSTDFYSFLTCRKNKSIVVAAKHIYTLEKSTAASTDIDPNEVKARVQAAYAGVAKVAPQGEELAIAYLGACVALAEEYGLRLTVEDFASSEYVKEYRKSQRQKLFRRIFGVYALPQKAPSLVNATDATANPLSHTEQQ